MNIAILIISYLLGTIPFALIVTRLATGKDITKEGTGNIGAMNSYDITGRKWVGIVVFILDFLKGLIGILIAHQFGGGSLTLVMMSLVLVILGHNFNIFLKFKGGRGLATAAGAYFMINPLIVIHWAVSWLIGFFVIRRNVHVANVIATVATPVLLFSSPEKLIRALNIIQIDNLMSLKIWTIISCAVILSRHIEPIIKLLKDKKSQ